MKPSAQQYSAAVEAGAQARRNGRKVEACPYKSASTEPLQTLREGWIEGYRRESMERGR